MTAFVKTILISLQFILVTAVLSIGYGFIVRGRFTLAYVFKANFLLGAVIICIALVMMFLPSRIKFDKLTDHTTFIFRFMEQQKPRKKKAYELLSLGGGVVIIAGVIQLILAAVIPR